jgi:hypothetical protein
MGTVTKRLVLTSPNAESLARQLLYIPVNEGAQTQSYGELTDLPVDTWSWREVVSSGSPICPMPSCIGHSDGLLQGRGVHP